MSKMTWREAIAQLAELETKEQSMENEIKSLNHMFSQIGTYNICPFLNIRVINNNGRNYWGVSRVHSDPAVIILAKTKDNKVLITVEHRPLLNKQVISVPAGLQDSDQGETEEDVVCRELLEETGYSVSPSSTIVKVLEGSVSPGITDELVSYWLVDEVFKTDHVGEMEAIEVGVDEALEFCMELTKDINGVMDVKLPGILAMGKSYWYNKK